MLDLAKRIKLDEKLIKRLEDLSEREMLKVRLCSEKCSAGNFLCLKKENKLIRLAVILLCAKQVRKRYDEAGIDEKIYYDTMSDIRIWCEHTGNKGLKNYNWLKNHVSFELFRLDRLQFQFYECKNKALLYNKLPFSRGERLIYVHIPEGEKLEKEYCEKSFTAAEEFFGRYFPSYSYRYYFCESWLLFEDNRNFMKKDCNILSFASIFTHAYSFSVDAQAIERIFGKRRLSNKSYPEKTSLQKSAKKYMLSGHTLGCGVGYIDREGLKKLPRT